MGFFTGIALYLVGLVAGLLFFSGILIQIFGGFAVGIAVCALAVLLHFAKEGFVIYNLRRKGGAELSRAKGGVVKGLLWRLIGGAISVFVTLSLRSIFTERTFLIFIGNEIAYTIVMIIPLLVILALPQNA